MNSIFEFDFDDWAELARRDPAEFSRRRDQVVETVCEQLGGRSQPVIAGICWRIDLERKRCTSPMQLCVKLSALMWRRHYDLTNALNMSHTGLLTLLREQHGRYRLPERRQALLLAGPSSKGRRVEMAGNIPR